MLETTTGVLCPLLVVKLGPSMCTTACINLLVNSPCSELRVTTMDVEKQSNGSIAYLCSGLNPCTVRFDHRSHLATCLENCQVTHFPVLGERKSAVRKPKIVELHCSCRMPEEKGDEMAQCDVCHVWYHRHCMDIPSEVSVRDVYMSNEQSESCYSLHFIESVLLYRVATSNHTRVCLHSRDFPTLRVVCICLYNYVYVICLCVCVYLSELLLELLHTQGCLYICA